MLYDPKWEQQTRADPLTLESLITWLEKQPANKEYCYVDSGHCLAAQYNLSTGRKYEVVCPLDKRTRLQFDIDLEDIAQDEPRTFGAALDRARTFLHQTRKR